MELEKIQKLVKYSTYAFVAWAASWILFFIMLPFMINMFGKVRGSAINYAISWITMPLIILGLEYYNRLQKKETPLGG